MTVHELTEKLQGLPGDEEVFIWGGNYPWENYGPVKAVERRNSIRLSFEKGGATQYDKLVVS